MKTLILCRLLSLSLCFFDTWIISFHFQHLNSLNAPLKCLPDISLLPLKRDGYGGRLGWFQLVVDYLCFMYGCALGLILLHWYASELTNLQMDSTWREEKDGGGGSAAVILSSSWWRTSLCLIKNLWRNNVVKCFITTHQFSISFASWL